MSRTTVWRTLTGKLLPFGMVEKSPEGMYRAVPLDGELLDKIAAQLGVDGAGDLQGARYEAMREVAEVAPADTESVNVARLRATAVRTTSGEQSDLHSREGLAA